METIWQQELERALEEERRRLQEEREREIWAEFNRLVEEHLQRMRESSNRGYGYSAQTTVVDDLVPEPEEELEAGDASELDAFLYEFLAPGV